MEIVLLVGSAPYRLTDEDARWLVATIRQLCTNEHGQPLDSDALNCL